MKTELKERCSRIEESYEYMLAYAAQGLRAEPGGGAGSQVRTTLGVIDNALSPYHWDFLASRMPQQLDSDPATDLPLDAPPHTWLRGFGDPDEPPATSRCT